ncbi:MAG: signal recognition particle protein [Varibaculum sp.]|nr:signal recognition particle protein [Varibaculum sp.]
MFNSLSDRLTSAFQSLRGRGVLTESDVDKTVSEIRRALIDADVALPVVRSFTNAVRERAYGAARTKALNPAQQVIRIVNDELVEMLGGDTRELARARSGPTVYMLAGLQGAGKTTLAAKLGKWFAGEGERVLLVASDLQRPQAVSQLQILGERAGVDVWAPEPGNGVGNPIEVAGTGLNHAIENGYTIVIVDTAGRLGVDEEMMVQARAIRERVNPHEVLFVLDSMTGQDAVQTSVAFRDGVGFTGVVLSKLDGDARGGAALSVRGVTGAPVLFASTGEGLDDFERFHPDRMASRILDMGDMLTLIEQAEKAYDAAEAEKLAKKMRSGEFTLDDFLEQMNQLRKMGSIKGIISKLPGMGQYREALDNFDESQIGRIEAIIHSMTPAERDDVSILNGSRRARVARGSGTSVQAVNAFVKQFEAMRKMMKQVSGGGIPAMPGIPGMPGMAGARGGGKSQFTKKQSKKGKKKKKKGSGSRQLPGRQTQSSASQPQTGSAFGMPPQNAAPPTIDDLPDDLKRLLNR